MPLRTACEKRVLCHLRTRAPCGQPVDSLWTTLDCTRPFTPCWHLRGAQGRIRGRLRGRAPPSPSTLNTSLNTHGRAPRPRPLLLRSYQHSHTRAPHHTPATSSAAWCWTCQAADRFLQRSLVPPPACFAPALARELHPDVAAAGSAAWATRPVDNETTSRRPCPQATRLRRCTREARRWGRVQPCEGPASSSGR